MTQTNLGTALITGASSGIGALYADRLGQRGYDLILVARNRERLNPLAAEITSRHGRAVEVFPADLNDPVALRSVENKLKRDASITLLVNNAGIGTHTPLLESDVDQMARMIDLNVTALTRLSYAAVPGFVARGYGALINIASIDGVSVNPWETYPYQASKAALIHLTRRMAARLAVDGILVTAIVHAKRLPANWL